ncbi:alpha/beta-hydrolase [Pyrenochaeta sp. DS3sAY3a]|nr:alpha/beta-hydrolase [Pyrenochaeta sp. DS3sAY3a]
MAIEKAYHRTSRGQIHYRHNVQTAASSSTMPLIFLHKSASSSASVVKLMEHYSALDYACYAPDMPGFGNSFDPSAEDEELIKEQGTTWYCNIYITIFKELGIWNKKKGNDGGVHIMGHHSGAALALELAATYPDVVRSVCMIGPSVMSAAERGDMKAKLLRPFNEPVASGEHLMATWQYLGRHGLTSHGVRAEPPSSCSKADLALWQREALDHIRAWKGRMQIYAAVFEQDSEILLKKVDENLKVMVCCAKDDVLWPYFGNAKRI